MISGYLWLSDINRAVDKRLRDSEGDRLAGLHTIAEPNFTCMIGMAIPGITTAGTNNEEKTTITLLMRLSNQGAQSVAWNWHLKAKVTGEDLDADGDDSLSTIYNPGGPSNLAKLGPESNLSRLFAENPMATGAAKTGWVSFPFSRQQYDEPGRSGVVYIVSFLDSHFKIYSAQMTNLASQKSPNYGPLPIPAK
jgi:hypothetical protein